MKQVINHRNILVAVGLLLLTGISSSSSVLAGDLKIDSPRRNNAITIDGQDTDWESGRVFLDDIKGALGVVNDGEYLYLSLSTQDENLARQILFRGLVVWFDPDGGDDKMFGVQYPVRGEHDMFNRPPQEDGERPERPDPEQFRERLRDSIPTTIHILDSKDEVAGTLTTGASEDIQAQVHMDGDRLTYELRIPLTYGADHPFAIATTPGAKIGIGLETPKFNSGEHRGGGMHGGFGGGMPGGGMRGGKGGHGGPGMGRERPEMGKPLKIWSKVQLSGADAGSTSQN